MNIPHAFTTRLGGVSEGVFASLNIAMHRGDTDENVERNYEILADVFSQAMTSSSERRMFMATRSFADSVSYSCFCASSCSMRS